MSRHQGIHEHVTFYETVRELVYVCECVFLRGGCIAFVGVSEYILNLHPKKGQETVPKGRIPSAAHTQLNSTGTPSVLSTSLRRM